MATIKLSKKQWEFIGHKTGWIKKTSGKTWKDQKNYEQIILYHVSPNRIGHLMPRSTFVGHSGLFMSPSYDSIILDWAFYVIGKKKNKHPLEINVNEISQKVRKLEDQIEKIEKENSNSDLLPELKVQLQVLENKESNMIDAHNKDSHAQSMCDYQTIYLYKIACPQFIFNLASNLYYQTYDQT